MATTIRGSCLCGGVRYEVARAGFGTVVHCHCSMCRKATSAAFRTRAAVRADAFRWVAGEELVSRYRSSPGEEIGLPLGTLDDDPGVRPSAHVWVDSRAPWVNIGDGLPRYAEGAGPGVLPKPDARVSREG